MTTVLKGALSFDKDIIAQLVRRVLDDGVDVGERQIGIGRDDVVVRHPMGKETQNMVDSEASTLHDRFTAKNLWIGHNPANRATCPPASHQLR